MVSARERGRAGSGSGGLGAGGGAGERELDLQRQRLRRQAAALRTQLQRVRKTRALHRDGRRKQGILTVAIVGYTNAGKSTLLETLSGQVGERAGPDLALSRR